MENDPVRQTMVQQVWPGTPLLALPASVPQGQYANFVQVGSTQWEFVVDFGVLESTVPFGQAVAGLSASPAAVRPIVRIIVSPQNIKGICAALEETIRRYEETWRIELPDMRNVQPQTQPASPGDAQPVDHEARESDVRETPG